MAIGFITSYDIDFRRDGFESQRESRRHHSAGSKATTLGRENNIFHSSATNAHYTHAHFIRFNL